MKKLGSKGTKWLKIAHIIFVALWFGGIASLVALRAGVDLTVFYDVKSTYAAMGIIDELLIRNGAQGIIITSLIYSIWTNWGFFRHRWVAVKWVVFVGQLVLGIAFLNRWVGGNISLLANEKALALNNPIFLQNHSLIQIGTLTQVVLVIFLVCISVLKPWKKKNVGE